MTEGTTRPPLSERFTAALGYAATVHRTQKRKGTDIPYVAHLLAVAGLVLEHGADEDTAIAALLHDAVEDQGGNERMVDIRARFGSRVAAIVAGCTQTVTGAEWSWKERKRRYIDHVRTAPAEVRLVSLADKLHNARALLLDYREVGEDLWSRFHGGRDGTLWYYRSLRDAYGSDEASPLLLEFQRTVDDLLRRAEDGPGVP